MNHRKFIATGLALFAALYVLGHCTGCFTESKQIAADASYEAQQMACVDQYADRASIDRCRQRVKLAWRTDAGAPKDGGAE